jgi:hypothetical protein
MVILQIRIEQKGKTIRFTPELLRDRDANIIELDTAEALKKDVAALITNKVVEACGVKKEQDKIRKR